MSRRNRAWAIYDILLIVIVYSFTFLAIHYFITNIINAPTSFSLLLIIPVFMLLTPIVILAYKKTYNKYYLDNIKDNETSLDAKARKENLFVKFILFWSLFMIAYTLSFLYFVVRKNIIVALCFALTVIIIYIFILPTLKKMVGRIK